MNRDPAGWPWRVACDLAGAGFVAIALGCASAPVEAPPPASEELPNQQLLLRAQATGARGGGPLRLIVRTVASGDYEIQANDPIGRSLWTFRFEAAQGLLVDHRSETFCRTGDRVPIPDALLDELPLASIPRVLLGWAPVDVEPAPAGALENEYRDRDGGRWLLRHSGDALAAWTYFGDEERPIVWWLAEAAGESVLSHRDGSQLRWTVAVREASDPSLPEAKVEPRYTECPDPIDSEVSP